LVTSCDRELDSVVGLNEARAEYRRPFQDTSRVDAAPVLDNVAQLKGLEENFSSSRPPAIVTALFEVSQPQSLPFRCGGWVPPADVDMGGENEIVPVS
jgi:hypothetical protein